ncbi:hypothetical protein BpHYR1_020300 [Brachionus plicatilis]|uniref:Uncharacterized protein n=1 Tax=Brachionus plicatilis TaxID=10195 RepID=A0A3M7RCY3_BRAPC|nr:hypothetical protein BpHYR1_020300 [Brachionus plicatilis]
MNFWTVTPNFLSNPFSSAVNYVRSKRVKAVNPITPKINKGEFLRIQRKHVLNLTSEIGSSFKNEGDIGLLKHLALYRTKLFLIHSIYKLSHYT